MRVILIVFEDCHSGQHTSCRRQYQDQEWDGAVMYVCICEQCHG